MAFSGLDGEISKAREVYLQLSGYMVDPSERTALDGAYNSLKSPQRLLIEDDAASVDLKCESLEQMVTVLHRVRGLLATLSSRCCRRTGVGNHTLDAAQKALERSPSFGYFDHFTSAVKHTSYIGRGIALDGVYIAEFDYFDRDTIHEPRRTADEIIAMAREVITLSTSVMQALSPTLEESRTWDPHAACVTATPMYDPNLYVVAPQGSAVGEDRSIEQALQPDSAPAEVDSGTEA